MLAAYRKTIAAVFGAAGTWCVAALTDGRVTTMEWVALGIATATALGVYSVPNDVAARRRNQAGYGVVELLVAVVLLLLVVWLVLALAGR